MDPELGKLKAGSGKNSFLSTTLEVTVLFELIVPNYADQQCCGAGAGRSRTFLLEPAKRSRLRPVAM